jgi:hypothetical protein
MAGDAIAIALALVALLVSVLAYRAAVSSRNQRSPTEGSPLRVRVSKAEAARALADDTRAYVLHLDLTNDSDAAFTISSCRLRVTYRTRANFLGAVDLESQPPVRPGSGPSLELPLMMPPRSTLTRSVYFTTSNVIPRHCRVQDYAVIVSAEGGERVVADASLPSLFAADTDGQGPSTWGWD